MSSPQPRTLAEDLRSRSDDQISALLNARPDLVHPIPSDMRALTTRASTSPSIARYLDDVDVLHHFTLRVASELTAEQPTSIPVLIDEVVARVDAADATDFASSVHHAVDALHTAALLWGTQERTHIVTSVRDQVAQAPAPTWPPPSCSAPPRGAEDHTTLDQQAGAHVRSTISIIEEVGDLWRREPGAVLRSGGLSTRALDTLAAHLGADRFAVSCALDIAHSAGLLAVGATDSDVAWMPTESFDDWRRTPPGRRWALLAQTWRDRQGVTSVKPLVTEEHPFTATWRHHLLTVANEAAGACDIDAMLEFIDYRWPRRRGSKRSSVLRTLFHEAEVLGIMNAGGLSSAGRELADTSDPAALAKTVTAHLAAEVDTVLIQADHTIVAAGPLTPAVGRPLRDLADVESRGHGCVLRISKASLRRALTVDADPHTWIEFLRTISSKDVPQPVVYAITDAARSLPGVRADFVAPCPPAPRRRPRARATAATVDKTLRVLRAEELRDRVDEAPIDISEVPRMDSSTVVASVKYAIDHNETVHLTHAESDGSTAVLLVDPIRLGGGSLTAYDHHAEQVRTLAVSRISGVVAIQISA